MPTVKLGPHDITRLIIGGNPVYGHSHFNKMLSRYFTDWHTPDRVMALLRRVQEVGINTWQNSYAERTLADLERFRQEGGRLNWLCLGKTDWDRFPERIDDAARHKPIGIAPHGALAERLHRDKKLSILTDLLKRIRDKGVQVGLSAHNPELIELAEEKGWDIDYTCAASAIVPAALIPEGGRPESSLVKLPPTDPPQTQGSAVDAEGCLVYKVLAADDAVQHGDSSLLRDALAGIADDAMIVGMIQQSDQVGENAAVVRARGRQL